jgi:uncharacterized repeat protein (TIGR03803 family)
MVKREVGTSPTPSVRPPPTYWETQQTSRSADDLSDNTLTDISDVDTTGLTTGDLLRWNGTDWVRIATSSLNINTDNLTEGSNLFYTTARTASYIVSSSSIPHVSGSAFGDMLIWNGSGWATTSTSTLGSTLESLTDVDTTGKVAGNILYWTGTRWEDTSTSTLVADADLGTLTDTGDTLTITGGTGATIGNVSITIDADVEALADITGTGIIVRDADGSLVTRTFTSNTAAIAITNGNGVGANPVISLGTLYLADFDDVATSSLALGDLFSYNGTNWTNVATSTLGLGNNTFLGLADTISSFSTGRILFEGASSVTDDQHFVFENGNLGVGTTSPYAKLSVAGSVVAANFVATTSTSTLRGLTLSNLNCTTYGNNGKLTTDASGNLVCAPDNGGDGSGAAPDSVMTLLHEFAGGDGSNPYGSLVQDGTTLYGMTVMGGDSDMGTIFSIQEDGTGFTLLHEFAGGASDGQYPRGSFIKDGTTLYGMTLFGGDSDMGIIFSIESNGTGFTLLHEFAGGASDGGWPYSDLIQDGTTLYGMTTGGGDSDLGTIFSIESNGTGFTLLHEFAGGASDGSNPTGSLIQDGTTLYGMTTGGGDANLGTIFSIESNGTGFTLLHEFAGGASDGRNPWGDLTQDGSTLYGMTQYGGDSNVGTIFSMESNGTGFTLLHEFAGGVNDGRNPTGSLIQDGSTLYGMTYEGGDSNGGTIFSIATNGTGFTLLHEFAGGASDGMLPQSDLIQDGTTLYGVTIYGGDSDNGTIFSFDTATGHIQFNNGLGYFTADSNFTWNGTENTLTVTGTSSADVFTATGSATSTLGKVALSYASTTVLRAGAFYQSTLGACSGENQNVLYSISTGTFFCGTDDGAGAATNVWATTTDSLAIRPTNDSYTVLIGSTATTTSAKLEVHGSTSASSFTATSATATSTLPHLATLGFLLGAEDYVTDFLGSGLMITSGVLTLNRTGDWLGTFDGQEGSWYLANSFSTSSANYWETQQTSRSADNLADNALTDIGDVDTTGLTTGDLLRWNGTDWVRIATSSLNINTDNLTEGSNLFYTTARTASYIISSSSIPHVSGSAFGDMLIWNGSGWATTSTSTLGSTLESLTDVDTTGKVAGNILYWTGTRWEDTSTSTLVADADLGNLTDTGDTLTITGGTGATIGNVSITIDADVEALADITGTGIIVRDADGSLVTRTFTSNTAAIAITNGNGVGANPVISLGTLYLADFDDVATSSLALGDLFSYNGTNWTNVATSTLGLGNKTYLGLTDTLNAFSTGRILFEGTNTVTGSTTFVYDVATGNLGVGTTSPYARLSVAGSVVAANFVATTGTSTLRGLTLSNLNCTTYGNNGKLTTDASGNLVCAPDNGGDGSGAAPDSVMTLLHEFVGGASDGRYPKGSLIQDGSTFYGMTNQGGDSNYGTIFSIESNGTGYTLLHEFAGGVSDGRYPWNDLKQVGSTLYGTTLYGGDSNRGTIFSIESNGTGFTLLHEFAGGVSDGSYPYSSLIQDGSTLYGMTYSGGDTNLGTIFSIETTGTGFTLLHEFTGGVNDGSNPRGSLIKDGTTLYGMTIFGGDQFTNGLGVFTASSNFVWSTTTNTLTITGTSSATKFVGTGTATSTFAGGLQTNGTLDVDGTATSTFNNGIALSNGCFKGPDGQCLTNSTIDTLEELTDVGAITKNFGDLFYWTGTRWADIATSSLNLSTTDLIEGSKLFYTDARVAAYIVSSSSIPHIQGNTNNLLIWTGSGWGTTSTSTLGITGVSNFLGLTDTPSSYTAKAIPFVSGGNSLAFNTSFVFDGTTGNLGIGTSTPDSRLSVAGNTHLDSNLITFASPQLPHSPSATSPMPQVPSQTTAVTPSPSQPPQPAHHSSVSPHSRTMSHSSSVPTSSLGHQGTVVTSSLKKTVRYTVKVQTPLPLVKQETR